MLSETFIVNKVAGLLDHGWDVHVVCSESNPLEWERFPQLSKRPDMQRRVHLTWPVEPRYRAAMAFPVAISAALARQPSATSRYLMQGFRRFGAQTFRRLYLDAMIVKLRPAIVHFEFGALAHRRMHLKPLIGCRIVVSFRGYDLNYAGLEDGDYYTDVWRHTDAVHVLSRDLWKKALRRGATPGLRHEIIPPAIDMTFFQGRTRRHTAVCGSLERPLHILSIGRLVWIKGYEYALQTLRVLKDRGITCVLTIIGEGPFREAIQFAARQLGVQAMVRLVGARAPNQVREALLQADVMLHSAVSEGFCNAVLEAQAMGLPVVASDAGGLGENVIDGVTGFIVPRREPAMAAERLARLAVDPEQRLRFGDAGRRHAEEHFRLEEQIRRFDSLYRIVLEDRNGPQRAEAVLRPTQPLKTGA